MPDPAKAERKKSTIESMPAAETSPTSANLRSGTYYFNPLMLLAVALLTMLVVGPPLNRKASLLAPGDVAAASVKATIDFLVEDHEATSLKRQEAGASVPALYDLSSRAGSDLEESLREVLAPLFVDEVAAEQQGADFTPQLVTDYFRERLGVELSGEQAEAVAGDMTLDKLVTSVRSEVEQVLASGVVANRSLFLAEAEQGVTVRDLDTGSEVEDLDPTRVADFDLLRGELVKIARRGGEQGVAGAVAAKFVRPNLTYNVKETEELRRQAIESVGPVLYQVRKGEMIVREGDRVTREQSKTLEAHALAFEPDSGRWPMMAGIFVLSIIAIYTVFTFTSENIKKAAILKRDVAFLAFLFCFFVGLSGIVTWLAMNVDATEPQLWAVRMALPLGAGFVLARVIFNSETAIAFGLVLVSLVSFGIDGGLSYFFVCLFGGLAGAHKAARACKRSDLFRVGGWMGLVQAVVTLASAAAEGQLLSLETGLAAGAAFAGGLAGGLLALALIPLAEMVFGFTTDMKLMELASLDHPLLKQLMIRAPGTYHHSVVTGTLAGAGAEAIGARALLAMVAAYYHDVGKLSKPTYFIENMVERVNPHDRLAPSMSTLILTTHVKEGEELATNHKLGRDITDVIRQHHGTGKIHFFYNKAVEAARPGVDEVREADYRYPGPKPRSREAALVLLADAVEAAARTVVDPKPARIQGMVQNIINRNFSDGQLDECDLTLKDLHLIARSFTRILSGIHHQRIDYPLAAHKEKRENANFYSKRMAEDGDRRDAPEQEGKEDLKRLGI